MDSSSWKLLEAVRKELSPLLLLVSMRPGTDLRTAGRGVAPLSTHVRDTSTTACPAGAEPKLPPEGTALLAAARRSELSGLRAHEVDGPAAAAPSCPVPHR